MIARRNIVEIDGTVFQRLPRVIVEPVTIDGGNVRSEIGRCVFQTHVVLIVGQMDGLQIRQVAFIKHAPVEFGTRLRIDTVDTQGGGNKTR